MLVARPRVVDDAEFLFRLAIFVIVDVFRRNQNHCIYLYELRARFDDFVELHRPGQELGHVCVFPHLCDPSGWLTFDVEVVRVLQHVSLMLLDCSSIFDDVVEPGAHLRQGFPGVPHDLVGVVAEREPQIPFLLGR